MSEKHKFVGTECVATGLVFGNYWGGGQGGYAAKTVTGPTVDEVLEKATKMLDGSLDAGMGFESLIGALLDIQIIKKIMVEGAEYRNVRHIRRYVGKLTQGQKVKLAHWRDHS